MMLSVIRLTGVVKNEDNLQKMVSIVKRSESWIKVGNESNPDDTVIENNEGQSLGSPGLIKTKNKQPLQRKS